MSVSQLSRLLPLPEADLQQVLDYASTLSKQEAVDHFNNLLGESPQSIEFISSFNSRRRDPTPEKTEPAPQAAETWGGVPKAQRKAPKKKPAIHTPAPRQVQGSFAGQGTAYKKTDEDDYISKRPSPSPTPTPSNSRSLTPKPAAAKTHVPKAPPSAAGTLISDFKSKPPPSKQKAKVHITGGASMSAPPNSALSALDSAIRTLELSASSSMQTSTSSSAAATVKRRCNCIGARHPLLAAAPNCLNCGKVICVKEGLGPCTFCNSPLLSAVEVQSMMNALREERGREKMALDASSQRKIEVSKTPAPFSTPRVGANETSHMSPAEAKAKEHRDKLLGFQAQNAKRTTVRDEAADFDVPTAGTSMWASPAERARQLKLQQKVLAEQEWNARPEYEKRRQVVSIDLVKGKVVKRMAAVERPTFESYSGNGSEDDDSESQVGRALGEVSGNTSGGSFSRNPLLRTGLIKPVWKPKEVDTKEGEADAEEEEKKKKKSSWRRVQDDLDDNEDIILDGGAYGGRSDLAGRESREEPECG